MKTDYSLPPRNDTNEATRREGLEKFEGSKIFLRTLGSFALGASLIAFGYVSRVMEETSPPKDSPTSAATIKGVRSDAIDAAIDVIRVKEDSEDWARMTCLSLNHGTTMPMDTLNGQIEKKDLSGEYHPLFKNAILIHTLDPTTKPDAKGDFLRGAFLGVTSSDSEGKLVINVEPFDSEEMRFVAYGRNHPVLHVDAYATQYNVRDDQSAMTLVAFDQEGQKNISNPDGSTVSPGLFVGGGKG